MSLSDQNRALIAREEAKLEPIPLSPDRAVLMSRYPISRHFLNRLLDAARAEGRPSPEEVLADQNAVHINMLRGGIAKPSPAQIGHLYRGDEAAEVVREVIRQNPEAALSTPSPERAEGATAGEVFTDVFEQPFDGDDDPRLRAARVLTVREAEAVLEHRGDLVAALSQPSQGEQEIGDYQLHPKTAALVRRFMSALAAKLAAAEVKYGYSDGWADPAWQDECRRQLHHHAAKGDPRDVAAYAAFCWHHGWSTAAPEPGYEAEPVAWMTKTVEGGLKPVLAEDVAAWRAKGVTIDAQPLFYASPVPVAISREEIIGLITDRVGAFFPEDRDMWLTDVGNAADAILQRLSNQQGEKFAPTHRHVKRGTTYQLLGWGRAQCSESGLLDNEHVAIYRGEDGSLWARRLAEFNDGRFEAVSTQQEGER